MSHSEVMRENGLAAAELNNGDLGVISPIDGELVAQLTTHTSADNARMIAAARVAFAGDATVDARSAGTDGVLSAVDNRQDTRMVSEFLDHDTRNEEIAALLRRTRSQDRTVRGER